MIVYNVARRWFSDKVMADTYRKALGLKPSATAKITVEGRDDLSALLNALCEPPAPGQPLPLAALPATPELVERAYVNPAVEDFLDYVPRFLLNDDGKKRWDERHLKKGEGE